MADDRRQSVDLGIPNKRHPIDDYSWTNNLNTLLDGNQPFRQTDWPNPQPPKPRSRELWTYLWSTNPAYMQIPFNQTDWPVPKGYPFPIGGRTMMTIFQGIPQISNVIRRFEQQSAKGFTRTENGRFEVVTPGVFRRVDD